jgi:hypothetical protein
MSSSHSYVASSSISCHGDLNGAATAPPTKKTSGASRFSIPNNINNGNTHSDELWKSHLVPFLYQKGWVLGGQLPDNFDLEKLFAWIKSKDTYFKELREFTNTKEAGNLSSNSGTDYVVEMDLNADEENYPFVATLRDDADQSQYDMRGWHSLSPQAHDSLFAVGRFHTVLYSPPRQPYSYSSMSGPAPTQLLPALQVSASPSPADSGYTNFHPPTLINGYPAMNSPASSPFFPQAHGLANSNSTGMSNTHVYASSQMGSYPTMAGTAPPQRFHAPKVSANYSPISLGYTQPSTAAQTHGYLTMSDPIQQESFAAPQPPPPPPPAPNATESHGHTALPASNVATIQTIAQPNRPSSVLANRPSSYKTASNMPSVIRQAAGENRYPTRLLSDLQPYRLGLNGTWVLKSENEIKAELRELNDTNKPARRRISTWLRRYLSGEE